VGSIVGWKEAWVEGDLDLGLVAAAGRKTRGATRVSLYKKGIEGDLFLAGLTQLTFRGKKATRTAMFDGPYQFLYGWEQRCRMGSSSAYMG
jgi:hypothetical protein